MNTEDNWISVTDRFPNNNQWCLFWYGGKIPTIGIYKQDGRFIEAGSIDVWDMKDEGVTYWMPVPNRPTQNAEWLPEVTDTLGEDEGGLG